MRIVIIANGTLPRASVVRAAAEGRGMVVAADGGANAARELGWHLDAIVGDMDSITPETAECFSEVLHVKMTDQESTDLEKTIGYCLDRGATDIDVIGALAGRIDHVTGALGCFRRFGDRVRLRMWDEEGILEKVDGARDMTVGTGATISLIPLSRCEGVTTKNLQYALTDAVLEMGVREGISNVAIGPEVSVTVRSGMLLLYRFHSLP